MSVKLIDHMGTDLSVVNAARVSFAKEQKEFDLYIESSIDNIVQLKSNLSEDEIETIIKNHPRSFIILVKLVVIKFVNDIDLLKDYS